MLEKSPVSTLYPSFNRSIACPIYAVKIGTFICGITSLQKHNLMQKKKRERAYIIFLFFAGPPAVNKRPEEFY